VFKLLTGDVGSVQLKPVLTDVPGMGRKFSETFTIDDSHRLPVALSGLQSPSNLEKSELFVRRSSLPQAVKLDVEVTPPSPPQRVTSPAPTRQMQLTVPLPAQPRRFSETVVMELGTRHRSALEFEFQRPQFVFSFCMHDREMGEQKRKKGGQGNGLVTCFDDSRGSKLVRSFILSREYLA